MTTALKSHRAVRYEKGPEENILVSIHSLLLLLLYTENPYEKFFLAGKYHNISHTKYILSNTKYPYPATRTWAAAKKKKIKKKKNRAAGWCVCTVLVSGGTGGPRTGRVVGVGGVKDFLL